MPALAACSLAACSLFTTQDKSPASPAGVRLVLPQGMNPRPDRLSLTVITPAGDSSRRVWDNPPDTVDFALPDSLVGDGAGLKAQGYRHEALIHQAAISVPATRFREGYIELKWHPVYGGEIDTADKPPVLTDIIATDFITDGAQLESSGLYVYLAGAEYRDSAQASSNPRAIDLVLWKDGIHSAMNADSLGLSALMGEETGYCRLLPLDMTAREGYQAMTSMQALRDRWNESASRISLPLEKENWVLVREEDNLYLLHCAGPGTESDRVLCELYSVFRH